MRNIRSRLWGFSKGHSPAPFFLLLEHTHEDLSMPPRHLLLRAGSPSTAPPMMAIARVPGSGTALTPSGIVLLSRVIVLLSRVTAPLRANALPFMMFAPVSRVMLVSARICPSKSELVPSVAELPTCQNTL